ncbi:hypothetical protein FISHEDRAFT_74291 [Fistulina hepatica ATCC 64428]|uniref:Uncharacterized protein n=1 Tax=Fistulina hepatica ATCC 64428 TaxID=1128425 RepID=A0A0D7ACU1_9AGAR|nr:hypothetical protein FISHEDRAFT_74291 [Fistulina hepatica ATCC 64428]
MIDYYSDSNDTSSSSPTSSFSLSSPTSSDTSASLSLELSLELWNEPLYTYIAVDGRDPGVYVRKRRRKRNEAVLPCGGSPGPRQALDPKWAGLSPARPLVSEARASLKRERRRLSAENQPRPSLAQQRASLKPPRISLDDQRVMLRGQQTPLDQQSLSPDKPRTLLSLVQALSMEPHRPGSCPPHVSFAPLPPSTSSHTPRPFLLAPEPRKPSTLRPSILAPEPRKKPTDGAAPPSLLIPPDPPQRPSTIAPRILSPPPFDWRRPPPPYPDVNLDLPEYDSDLSDEDDVDPAALLRDEDEDGYQRGGDSGSGGAYYCEPCARHGRRTTGAKYEVYSHVRHVHFNL